MFMSDGLSESHNADGFIDAAIISAEQANEADDFQNLLNTVDAARAGLASGEHDFDILEEDDL